jgi:cellulose synthase/poly-beta-1,6-N-acetylglucosamine synthase-like glycosyltransferase
VLAGYPAVLAVLPRRPLRDRRQAGEEEFPTVTVIVPTYCEHDRLAPKLETLARLDYPSEKLQVVVVSDGDPELARIARATLPDATVVLLEERGGKPRALNAGIAAATGDILILTDAHSPLRPSSVKTLCRPLADRSVAAVSGRWAEEGSAYDLYEHILRQLESRTGSTACVFGALLAVRRESLPPFPADVINDDLWLLCRLIRGGGRVVYEPGAHAIEAPLEHDAQIVRRARISAGRMQLLDEVASLPPAFAWRLISHKVGRLALPALLLTALVSSLALASRPIYRGFALLQSAFYMLGLAGARGFDPPAPGRHVVRAATQFLVGNAGIVLGVVRAVRRRQSVHWDRAR